MPFKDLQFPSCHVGDVKYITLPLKNTGDVPFKFSLRGGENEFAFWARPNFGVIQPGGFQLITYAFSPNEKKKFSTTFNVTLQSVLDTTLSFKVEGYGDTHSLALPNISNGTIYMKPTCIGTIAHRACQVQNVSRVPLEFKVEIPAKYQEEITVDPDRGTLSMNQLSHLLVSFSPKKAKDYAIPLTLTYQSTPIQGTPYQSIYNYFPSLYPYPLFVSYLKYYLFKYLK